ncbi:MAG TPA: endopeptidase La [Anaerolineae bacterium]|nr:endopeptidase La [Anaerolineae bacterium]
MSATEFPLDGSQLFRPEAVGTMLAQHEESGAEQDADQIQIPDELPILPLRGVVVYPVTAVPLTVGQPRSVHLIDEAVAEKKLVGLVASKDPSIEEPTPDDCYTVGTLASVQRLARMPDGTIRLLVMGLERIRIIEYTSVQPYLKARVKRAPETVDEGLELEALRRKVIELFGRLVTLIPGIPEEVGSMASAIEDARQLAYAIGTYIRIDLPDSQAILDFDAVSDKLRKIVTLLTQELEVLELGHKIQSEAQSEMGKVQREYFLREQLKAIQRELGELDEQQMEVEEFRKKVAEAGMPEEAHKEAVRELDRMAKLPTAAAEYGVIRTYLDWLVNVPWSKITPDNLDIGHARAVLDDDHYGLSDIKERILEFLAVRKLRLERADEMPAADARVDYVRREREGVILCFVGPPGVGKTSLGQSIARAIGRKFIRQSLGGVRDEAEIRGFRRTYIGSMPGRIIQALRRIETRNPVFMLDEIDKLGMDFRGDPASALLEVLDPEQNREFRDHYLDVPFDLSQVMFICTANQIEPIPGPLRDRMEIIQLSSYIDREKVRIAQGYLIPRQIKENGLRPGEVSFTDAAIQRVIADYTREAGVRSLEREIGRACRKIVTRIAEGKAESVRIDAGDVPDLLGKKRFYGEIAERTQVPGVVTGLVWTPVGGDLVFIEATSYPGGKGFVLTGQLGDVMRESAQAALSYVRTNARSLDIPDDYFAKRDIHLHVPAGAQPKDGPSAGVTMATAIASLATGRPVRDDVAMTGEITLRGQVLPIGGVKEKVLAAHRAGLKTIILPKRNENDIDDVPEEARKELQFILADRVEQVIEAALREPGETHADGRRRSRRSIARKAPLEARRRS